MTGGCKGICIHFNGYKSARGRNTYKDDYIYCRECDCMYIFPNGTFCKCCHRRVRHQSWNGHHRKSKLETTIRI
jgi:hypothetical protein